MGMFAKRSVPAFGGSDAPPARRGGAHADMIVLDDADDIEVESTGASTAPVPRSAASSAVAFAGASSAASASSGASPTPSLFATSGTPITEAQAIALRQLLYGSDKRTLQSFDKSWHQVCRMAWLRGIFGHSRSVWIGCPDTVQP